MRFLGGAVEPRSHRGGSHSRSVDDSGSDSDMYSAREGDGDDRDSQRNTTTQERETIVGEALDKVPCCTCTTYYLHTDGH